MGPDNSLCVLVPSCKEGLLLQDVSPMSETDCMSKSGPADSMCLLCFYLQDFFLLFQSHCFPWDSRTWLSCAFPTDRIDIHYWQWIDNYVQLKIIIWLLKYERLLLGLSLCVPQSQSPHPAVQKPVMQNTQGILASVICHKYAERWIKKKGEQNIKQNFWQLSAIGKKLPDISQIYDNDVF